MKNLCKILSLAAFTILFATVVTAQVQFSVPKSMTTKAIYISFFDDYYPLGKEEQDKYSGLFDTFLRDFEQSAQFTNYVYHTDDYEVTIRTGAKGRSDILFGMYADTSLYEDWKFIYPAAVDNPVHLIMLPERVGEIKSIDDLKSMKGAIDSREHWSDFVKDQLSAFDIETIDNSYDLYGKLLRGEIDYIFTTYWFGMIEMMKLGVNDMVSVSKKSIWNMPVFIGVSKISRERDYLVHNLTKLMQTQEVRDKIKARGIEILEEVKQATQGVVPPSYVLEQAATQAQTTQENFPANTEAEQENISVNEESPQENSAVTDADDENNDDKNN